MALIRRVEVAVAYPQRVHLLSDSAVPPRDRLRARALVCYTTASGEEAEEYLPGRSSASRGQWKPGSQAVGKGAVELRFLSDQPSEVQS
jgi:hypothetical protein